MVATGDPHSRGRDAQLLGNQLDHARVGAVVLGGLFDRDSKPRVRQFCHLLALGAGGHTDMDIHL